MYGKSVHLWCTLGKRGAELEVLITFMDHQVARHIILCITAYPQEYTLDEMQILCSESCASFATNISSDEGVTFAVNFYTQLQGNYI
jgi:hypothetical protein